MKFTYLPIVIVFIFSSCDDSLDTNLGFDPQLETTEAKVMIAENNAFALDFFKEVVEAEEEENFMVSPLSLSLALGMTYNGADGETATAFGDVLGYTDTEANTFNQKLIASLTASGSGVTLNLANAIWIKDGFPVEADFINTNKRFYDAEVDNLDFGREESVKLVNNWASSKTNGKIEKVVERFEPLTVLFLANALYFKGDWKFEFDADNTRPGTFYALNGEKEVPMMRMTGTVPYLWNEKFASIALPYKNDRFEMLLFLPHLEYSTNDIVAELTTKNVDEWLQNYNENNVSIQMPKFKTEYENVLNDELEEMGLEIAFTRNANFGRINSSLRLHLHISEVLQKTFIEVNEKGTEAAAVTTVTIELTNVGGSGSSAFILDRPFLYMIRDSYTGSICFMGRVGEP